MFEKDAGRAVRVDLFGGRGEVTVRDLLGRRDALPFEAVLGCTLTPGGTVGRHHQETAHEVVIAISGRGVATVGDVRIDLVPGAVAHVKLGDTLALENASDVEPLHYLIVKAR